jgi:type VI secretion system secreted protein Hcp
MAPRRGAATPAWDRRLATSAVRRPSPGSLRLFPLSLEELFAMAFDTYMQIDDGSDVVGEATASGIPTGAFELYSFSVGGHNPTTVGTHGGGLSAGKVAISSFNVMKKTEKSSPKLFSACCTGQHYKKAQVICRKATGTSGKQQVFLQYDFTDVMVESIQWSGSHGGDDSPTESVSFVFGKVKVTYSSQDSATGAVKKASEATWDVCQAQPS